MKCTAIKRCAGVLRFSPGDIIDVPSELIDSLVEDGAVQPMPEEVAPKPVRRKRKTKKAEPTEE